VLNSQGWKTNRKLIIFESDDWGSIRMPSNEVFNRLVTYGLPLDTHPFSLFDTLESNRDLEALFEVLTTVRDHVGKNPIITANIVCANPDFDKISNTGFNEYYYEHVCDTFNRYHSNFSAFNMWIEGYKAGCFFPQFHGREHVNIPFWLRVLKADDPAFKLAFSLNCWGLTPDIYPKYLRNIQASFDCSYPNELVYCKHIIEDGLVLFKKTFGFQPKSFIPNNFILPKELNCELKGHGIKYIQGMKYQLLPITDLGHKRTKYRRVQGKINDIGIIDLVRNVHFEPSMLTFYNRHKAIEHALWEIQNAFFWGKPAIVSIHRLNFVCGMSQKNRDINLSLFKILLKSILKKWPDIEFMTTVSLGDLIWQDHSF